jgi:hypothetical protein
MRRPVKPWKRAQPLPTDSATPAFPSVACALTAVTSAIDGAAACPPCALPASGRFRAAFARPNSLMRRDRRL